MVAVGALTAALLFVCANVVVVAGLRARQWFSPHRDLGGLARRVGVSRLLSAYPGWTQADLELFLAEKVRNNRWEYEAFTEFRQEAVQGRFINVSPSGYRMGAAEQHWPPPTGVPVVFFLGGSTAYGDGVPDATTISSRLQDELGAGPRKGTGTLVYNFGRPGYYSSQERALFEQLLLLVRAPTTAIFLDGLNETFQSPIPSTRFPWTAGRTGELRRLLKEHEYHRTRYHLSMAANGIPLVSFLLGLHRERVAPPGVEENEAEAKEYARGVIARWSHNKRLVEAVAAAYGVRVLFVWQPIPAYEYEDRFHFLGGASAPLRRQAAAYRVLEELRAEPDVARNLLWLADIQSGRRENMYVDDVHYTEAFSEEIAARIAKALTASEASK